jgi:hypothetical protein
MRKERSMRAVHRLLMVVALGAAVGGCAGSAVVQIPPSGDLEHVTGSATGQVVLSALGAQRIGLQTAPTQSVPVRTRRVTVVHHGVTGSRGVLVPIRRGAPRLIIPYSAVIYSATGQTFAFTNVAPLRFVETPITVATISRNFAYLSTGPAAGTKVVSVGAEELYGIQTGVLAQT